MNDLGLMMIYQNRPNNPLAWNLFECLDKEERDRIWDLLYKECNREALQEIDDELKLYSLSEEIAIKKHGGKKQ